MQVADIGCGTGASTLVLAEELDADITAVDFLEDFLDQLAIRAQAGGCGGRIKTQAASMDALAFEAQSLDAIWSEGAIYNMGFEKGIRAWRPFLKPGGILALSELTWLTGERPAELDRHWMQLYPEVATASAKIAVLEANGYAPVGYFALGKRCWLENYYRPLQARFADFLARQSHSQAARALVQAEEEEIALYERFSAYYSYGYFLASRTAD
ncbi:MAG: class I SAM-dependent methyltransferase [Kiloniellales bacterium]